MNKGGCSTNKSRRNTTEKMSEENSVDDVSFNSFDEQSFDDNNNVNGVHSDDRAVNFKKTNFFRGLSTESPLHQARQQNWSRHRKRQDEIEAQDDWNAVECLAYDDEYVDALIMHWPLLPERAVSTCLIIIMTMHYHK